MPVVPSFTGFAPTPNAAQAYGAGASTRLGYANIAQRAAEASAQLATQRQLAEMEMQAKTAQFAKETALKQQELEIEKAYREGIMRMQEGQLQTEQGALALKQLQAEREFGAQRMLRAEIPQGLPGDIPTAVARWGSAAGINIPGGTTRGAPIIPPRQVTGPGGTYEQFEEGEPVRRVPREANFQIGPITEAKMRRLEREIDRESKNLNLAHAGFAKEYQERKANGTLGDMDPGRKGQALAYLELLAKIQQLEQDWQKILDAEVARQGAGTTPAQLPSGMGGGGTTNRVGRFEVIEER